MFLSLFLLHEQHGQLHGLILCERVLFVAAFAFITATMLLALITTTMLIVPLVDVLVTIFYFFLVVGTVLSALILGYLVAFFL